MKKAKSYADYKKEFDARHDSIMAKYGAPPEAKPPEDRRNPNFRSFDKQFRRMAFTKRRTLAYWPDKDQL